ncbi:hypothetical protein [Micromonospora cathayae]|uniref:Uncharacterized protein n=1 Tax=Micromonospora cathayae TaxID=3028804 RepID=A0ABY7ZSP6_9ACTN|nr:hypothetical protein [Micromonospora sp. HUAS 3]WDZ85816.1 hypothetical protein PVK37_05120 [Micromonospora sp. HUAS 3]
MSPRLTRRARRSTLALLTGAALATLLSVTSATAAPLAGTTRGGVGTAAVADVWMKDHPDDVGLQPHSLNPIWESPDIKVCHTAVECAVSQNPIAGVRNYLFIKFRNNGPYAGPVVESGVIEVFRTPSSGGSAWPDDWVQIGWMAVPSYPGVTTVTIPWDDVPGPGHFCLVARWVSPNDPMTFQSPDIGVTVRNNNNIAWRNVDSVPLVAGGLVQTRPYTIGNALTRATRNSLVFSEVGAPLRTAGGRLVADLGPALYERWLAGGKAGKGIRDVGRNQIEIVDPAQASLDNLTLNPKEKLTLQLNFSATTVTKEPIAVRVTQIGPNSLGQERADLGGVRYDVTVGQRAG